MLSERIEGYKANGKFPSVMPARYKNDYPFLKEVDSLALANVQLNLQSAFRNCFSKSMKKNNGFPKFKSSKHSCKAHTTNNQKGTVAIIDDKYIKLPKIGKVKLLFIVILTTVGLSNLLLYHRNQMSSIISLGFLSLITQKILMS
nr:hypothetical protein [Sharpea azabuensis]